MTYGIRNILGVNNVRAGKEAPKALIFHGYSTWSPQLQKAYDYVIGCHSGHLLEFAVAVFNWLVIFPLTFPYAATWSFSWVSKVLAFNLVCELIFYGFWHWNTYVRPHGRASFEKNKFNAENQYEKDGKAVRMFRSSTGQLEREIFLTTCGWLQSTAFQCVMMYLWASGRLPYYDNFFAHPVKSIGGLLLVTYWREFHFYWCHRAMHPWWDRKNGLAQGDVGAFLYRHVHSLHHKSHNPGPWSGLSMHPVEHFLYYTCTLLSLFYKAHPLHFLYVKAHADIAPIGGHDGYGEPAGNGDFHWLHHHRFECNYGVPLIDFDRLFGTWVDYHDFKKTGSIRAAKEAANVGDAKTK